MSIQRRAGFVLLVVAALLMISTPALAKKKNKSKSSSETVATHGVPFSCGPNDQGFGGVVPGEYETAITVTNLNAEPRRGPPRHLPEHSVIGPGKFAA